MQPTTQSTPFIFACPRCRMPLTAVTPQAYCCPTEEVVYHQQDGIWRFLLPERQDYFQRFILEYETVRQDEGWGQLTAAYYRALPFADLSGRFPKIWQIRTQSFKALNHQLLMPMMNVHQRPLHILDIGAGNGWLSYRLAQAHHQVAAVDLLINPQDGLGTHAYYDAHFTAVQAEFDHLPFTSSQADVIIFNGSIHYATDYSQTLKEAVRILRPNGCLILMDTPIYHNIHSGQQMVQERQTHFAATYGFRGDALPNENFLTFERLTNLATELKISWQMLKPAYGWRWAIRPWLAKIRRQREPATFLLIVGTHA